MEQPHLQALKTFTLETLPTLDVAVLGALERFSLESLPAFDVSQFGSRPLVVGSEGALATGKILFREADAEFANEGTYGEELARKKDVDGVVIISASGGKHAVGIAQELQSSALPVWLVTNNENVSAREFIENDRVLVFPKNREPYTYNTSTYLGMILAQTQENPSSLHAFIRNSVAPSLPENLDAYDAFYFIIPEHVALVEDLFLAKFDELFGARISARVFTEKQTEHAKTVVPSEKELFVSFGAPNEAFGNLERRITIPLPESVGYGGMIAVGYYVIGKIQEAHPPYFKENVADYARKASELFGQDITPIVESR